MSRRIPFSVVQVTSQEDPYLASNLSTETASTKGWRSARLGISPQELTIKFDRTIMLDQLQIYSHHYLISRKVELWLGVPMVSGGTTIQSCDFRRLGHFSLSSNEKTAHRVRELRTVEVHQQCLFVKFRLHSCHPNSKNLYNQVSLIAINALGSELDQVTPGPEVQFRSRPVVDPMEDIGFHLRYDRLTAAKIQQLDREKRDAVSREDFMRAKELKMEIDRLHTIGQQIAQLEDAKKAAIEREDYDEAQSLKLRIEELRMPPRRLPGPPVVMDSQPPVRPELAQPIGVSHGIPEPVHPPTVMPMSSFPSSAPVSTGAAKEVGAPAVASPSYPEPKPVPTRDAIRPMSASKQRELFGETSDETRDRIAQSSGAGVSQPARGIGAVGAPSKLPIESRPIRGASSYEEMLDAMDPDTAAPKVSGPREIPEKFAEKAAPLIASFSEEFARLVFSTQWQHRLEAIGQIKERFQQGNVDGNVLSGAVAALCILAEDRQVGIIEAIQSVFKVALVPGRYSPPLDRRVLHNRWLPVQEKLISRLGERNKRVEKLIGEAISEYVLRIGGELALPPLLEPIPLKLNTAWAGRSLYVRDLLNSDRTMCKLMPRRLLDWIQVAFESSQKDVRKAAIAITCMVYEQTGPSHVRAVIPQFRNMADLPHFHRSLLEGIQKINLKHNWTATTTDPLTGFQHSARGGGAPSAPAAPPKVPEDADEDVGDASGEPFSASGPVACQFCGIQCENGRQLELHCYSVCPYLTMCPAEGCGHIYPIEQLQEHIFLDHPDLYTECPRCHEPVPNEKFERHVASGKCIPQSSDPEMIRCPLCHCDFSEDHWADHIESECPRNQERIARFRKQLESSSFADS